MKIKNTSPYRSIITNGFRRMIESGNKWMTLSGWIFKSDKKIFLKLEVMMIIITILCIGILLNIHYMTPIIGLIICLILIQRPIEFLVVYSRNFILGRGKIFSHFPDPERRGQWLLLMFSLNILQISLIFAIWYRFLSIANPSAFNQSLGILDSFYFSMITFMTIGYGDIVPLSDMAKSLVIIQNILTFYTLVIVINGLISMHFKKK